MLDDLPSATVISSKIPKDVYNDTNAELSEHYYKIDIGEVIYDDGLPVARYNLLKKELSIMNHLNITVEVHKGLSEKWSIVGFDV